MQLFRIIIFNLLLDYASKFQVLAHNLAVNNFHSSVLCSNFYIQVLSENAVSLIFHRFFLSEFSFGYVISEAYIELS